MRNSNGSNACLDDGLLNTVNGSVEPVVLIPVNPSEAEFIDQIKTHGVHNFSKSLKMVHDLALYHTDLCLHNEEKAALFDLKILWEGLEQME